MNLSAAYQAATATAAVTLILCGRCHLLRVPRPGKFLCAACEHEIEILWGDVTPLSESCA